MDDTTGYASLLNGAAESNSLRKASLMESIVRWIVILLIRIAFLTWLVIVFFFPTAFVTALYQLWDNLIQGTVIGSIGSTFLFFNLPIIAVVFLSAAYIVAFSNHYQERKKVKFLKFRLWTFPVLVNGPFGVVSAAEFMGILIFYGYIIFSVIQSVIQYQQQVSREDLSSKAKSLMVLDLVAEDLGALGLSLLTFLFIPITRGSVLLRYTDIPIEHATRYHIWLGHLVMVVLSSHGLSYIVLWILEGCLLQKILEWKNNSVAILPGVIALMAGILMWISSLNPIRKRWFELFLYTHQLYIIFVVFFVLHIGTVSSPAAAGIFLFLLDRFLRFWQSRSTADVVSMAILPCGTVKLDFAKSKGVKYNSLGFIFLQVREISLLQWHPFSVCDSPLSNGELSILVKPLGDWTWRLRQATMEEESHLNNLSVGILPKLTASLEGPYGHEIPYHFQYEKLILVAGGIGMSPFLAVLGDIIQRMREKKPWIPKDILVIWAVKKFEDASLLSLLDTRTRCSSSSEKLNLQIQIFVTQESEPPLEENKFCDISNHHRFHESSRKNTISGLVGTGNNFWSCLYITSSFLGFLIFLDLIEVLFVKKVSISYSLKGFTILFCMAASILLVGSFVVFLWHRFDRRLNDDKDVVNDKREIEDSQPDNLFRGDQENIISSRTIRYGCRPNIQEIFGYISKEWGNIDIGVIVCGPSSLQSNVAQVCRDTNIKEMRKGLFFHFNDHSFTF